MLDQCHVVVTGLGYFQNVILLSSQEDGFVPFHSARIELSQTALEDRKMGPACAAMANNIIG
jgi:hypothetical protein